LPDDEGEEDEMGATRGPQRPRSFGETLAIVSGPLALVAVIAVLLVLLVRGGPLGGQATSAPPPQTVVLQAPPANECVLPPAAPAPVAAVVPAPAAPVVATPPPPPETVRVALQNLPEGATATVNGAAIEGSSVSLPRSDVPVTVRVAAPGYEELSMTVVPSADVVLAVALSRASAQPSPAPTAGGTGPVRAPVVPRERAVSPPRTPAPQPVANPFSETAATRLPTVSEDDVPAPRPVGTLRVQCVPWARVAVPGHGTYSTPFSLDLPAGAYRLLLANQTVPGGDRPRMVSVSIAAGETTKVNDCW
jgi:hypothetical protein